ncbi:hypothetical protein [Corynebacterium comes]|uniref:Uncharacterized protein n=1 Tax=Corynebacterium comes TaxID=2675218 RepID=A0A6B8VJB8_9CORY|nr:hypothetical protein [Corynebacterium comes]QGU04183.1 hypothetical protein CETAM_04560 [Corynebacterium comes]
MSRNPSEAARRLARLSLWMLLVFVVWTIIFILATEPMQRILFGFTPSHPGDTFYIEAWGPWIATTLVWVIPLIVGLVLAVLAAMRGAGKLAWSGIAIHGLLLAFFIIPNVIDRLINL